MKAALLLLVAVVTVASPALAIDFPTGYPQGVWYGIGEFNNSGLRWTCLGVGATYSAPGQLAPPLESMWDMHLSAVITTERVVTSAGVSLSFHPDSGRPTLYSNTLLAFDPYKLQFVFDTPAGPLGVDIDETNLWRVRPWPDGGFDQWIPGDFRPGFFNDVGNCITLATTPEPGALMMLLVGGVALLRRR